MMVVMARYRMYAWYRFQLLAMFVIFGAVGVGILVAAASGHGPVAFSIVWVAIAVWNGYWFLLRVVYDLELSDGTLTWRTPLRSGAVSVAELGELRPSRFGSNLEIIELVDGSRLVVFVRKGFRAFADQLVAVRPDLPVRLGWQARFAERMPGWSGFRRRNE